ncbi:calcium/sodium antiporter [Altererythrobacter sp.]|uniref:calcium/sodium antiporter n=1 Tax=Altererythrobacter sp. TaxID=1872480 RepID=UPI001B15F34A|nr:calcium/sodium antiporter [Altererythrobacter sp.]MBO6608921.1 calcium/sodium antiporter [Altererythrobacter sp.]MBO6640961.1 calcium/sodium antiporter [Altererythrobacter sp.]MBO6708341.1 calcium/sodium antiporter [Altererythrobacter sp.]MBO6945523.1 calcium/sodium antiporter [Altererythrobacter sp.]
MIEAILYSLAGLVGLAVGGELLVRGSVSIAQRLGVSNLVTGLVIVGFATSMPEMVASIEAALAGSPGIAWGNVVGSNLANTLLILGATALVMPIALSGTGRRDAIVALVASLGLWALTAAQIGSIWVGIGLLLGILAYIYWRYNHPHSDVGDDEDEPEAQTALTFSIVLFLGGLGLLVFGGQLLVSGAIDMARIFGVSETAIGLTVVAIGTSLPELAASIAAAVRGKPGLAIGNVVGSNIYNILLIGGATMTIAPFAIPADLLTYELALLALSAVAFLALVARAKQIGRAMGAILLIAFTANIVIAFT